MSSDEFVTWLRGFLAGAGGALTDEQTEKVTAELAKVAAPLKFFPASPAQTTPYMPTDIFRPPFIVDDLPPYGTPWLGDIKITCGDKTL